MVRAPNQAPPLAAARYRGFSLVELVVVIVITGIMASVVGLFITGPIQGFLDQSRRAGLVDVAQLTLTRFGRDLGAALPNSVRLQGNALELLLTTDGDRYRNVVPGADIDVLSFDAADASFNTLAPLSPPTPVPGLGGYYDVTGALAIYPLQQSGANPYVATDNVMTSSGSLRITTVANNGQTEYQVSLPAAHRFTFDSPTHRVFLVSGPVTWLCSPPQLLRYDGYAVSDPQPVPPAGTPVVIADNVQSCAFQYAAGTAERNAVVSIALALADPAEPDERVRLLRQVYVSNTP